jgi:hypothetical protein
MEDTNETIDFSSKDFADTQKLLSETAHINSILDESNRLRRNKLKRVNETMESDDANDVIQGHLDEYTSPEALKKYLDGDVNDEKVKERIRSFFINDETGDELEFADNPEIKTEEEKWIFLRDLLLYFKQSDYYMDKIDEEVEAFDKAKAELDIDIATAIDPLKNNVLAYAEFLEQNSVINDDDSKPTIIKKMADKKRAKAIRSGYTLENLVEVVNRHPNIIENSLADFRNDNKVKAIGAKYSKKIKSKKINFSLFSLLSDDIHDSLEYKCLPIGEYPEGLENFTVFFIIRCLSMGLTAPEDVIFHASVQVCFTNLLKGELDEGVADNVKAAISRFLQLFNK